MSEEVLKAERERAIHLLRSGHSVPEVAQALGHSERWVRKRRKRFEERGPGRPQKGQVSNLPVLPAVLTTWPANCLIKCAGPFWKPAVKESAPRSRFIGADPPKPAS